MTGSGTGAPSALWTKWCPRSTANTDFNTLVLTIFAATALLLAAIGIYGLMAYSVEQRTQEIGIRLALGAESGAVRNMVDLISRRLRLALVGVVIGVGSAFRIDQADREPVVWGEGTRSPGVHRCAGHC